MTTEGTPREVGSSAQLGLSPMEQLLAFVDWEKKHNPQPFGDKHVAEWAAEEIERLHDVLEKLRAWANAYPLTVFPEPDFARAHELLQAGGMTLDAISASNMRHVIEGVRKLVDEGLGPNVRANRA